MLRQVVHLATKPLAFMPSGPQNAALGAALALVGIQVGIGIVLKISQTGGSYAFSPSASVTISEFFKMLLSTLYFYRECRKRAADGIGPATRGGGAAYGSLAGSELPIIKDDEEKAENGGLLNGNGEASETVEGIRQAPMQSLNLRTFWNYFRGEVTVDVRYGFCNLAMFYVLINNSIFVSYKMADPGTIQLTKSGVTFITALVMIVTLDTKISKTQWIAIIIQICGLAVTQYNPTTGSTYPLYTYLILLFQVFLSASSGVYNQALLKTDDSSLHADNMILYAAGTVINLLVHIVVSVLKADEPGFFSGYNSFGAIMVIVNNVFIGLAITAVYKYADAVIKCFATAVATGILLVISPVLFASPLNFLVAPGTIIVFISSWLYISNPPPKDPNAPKNERVTVFSRLSATMRQNNRLVLTCSTVFTVVVVAFLTMSEAKMPDLPKGDAAKPSTGGSTATIPSTYISPFKNTLAMIRWNSPHPERVPLLLKYKPFFDTVHISLPDSMPGQPWDAHNITYDQWPENGTFTVYLQLAHTMQLILDEHPEITGLLYYHFDAWVDPLSWEGANMENLWFPKISEAVAQDRGPPYVCMNRVEKYGWWGFSDDHDFQGASKQATRAAKAELGYDDLGGDHWCLGWSDLYYVPRKYFADWIALSAIFGRFNVFHEVAVPTMITIIERTRRPTKYRSLIDFIGDCWGSCCSSDPTAEEVTTTRCGHRMDYRQEAISKAFYNHLDEEARMLGQTRNVAI